VKGVVFTVSMFKIWLVTPGIFSRMGKRAARMPYFFAFRFSVEGAGFRVRGSGFRVQGLRFRIQGLRFRV